MRRAKESGEIGAAQLGEGQADRELQLGIDHPVVIRLGRTRELLEPSAELPQIERAQLSYASRYEDQPSSAQAAWTRSSPSR